MGFFRKMFGRNVVDDDPVRTTSPAATTRRHVDYDPKLIDKLLSDHSRLGGLYARIGEAHKKDEHEDVRRFLQHFKSSLQAHILVENVRFYAYVEALNADDPDNSRLMHEFRREMNAIARQVVEFVKTYQNSHFATEAEHERFTQDYARVGTLLEQRLDREENELYPLYAPD